MGGEQAARTMQIVMRDGAGAQGRSRSTQRSSQAQGDRSSRPFERQADAFYTSGLLLDDGVIDPRDTRRVLALCLAICDEAKRRTLRPMQFGVARPVAPPPRKDPCSSPTNTTRSRRP